MTSIRLSNPVAGRLGLGLAMGNLVALAVMPRHEAFTWYAVELAACYLVYLGFAFGGRTRTGRVVESGFAAVGVAVALVGLRHPTVLVAGWLAHGVWDVLHHQARRPPFGTRDVPRWYIPLCVGYDLVTAVGILPLMISR